MGNVGVRHVPRRVLWVSFYLPFDGHGTAGRVARFVRHLGEVGWRPTVITSRHALPGPGDPGRPAELPADVVAIRTRSLDMIGLGARVFPGVASGAEMRFGAAVGPGLKLGWVPFAVRRGLHDIRHSASQVIVGCVPPLSAALVANTLYRSMGLPYVLDLSGELARVAGPDGPRHWRAVMRSSVARRIVDEARALTAANEDIARALIDLHPGAAGRTHVIEDDVDASVPGRPPRGVVQMGSVLDALVE